MALSQLKNFTIVCDVVNLLVSSPTEKSYIPQWFFRLWQGENNQDSQVRQQIEQLKAQAEKGEDLNRLSQQLIKYLDRQRYLATIHLQNAEFRSQVQDALLAILLFTPRDVERYQQLVLVEQHPEAFIDYLAKSEELQQYKTYFLKKHAIHGRFIESLSDDEITLAAKGGLINSHLFHRWGTRQLMTHALLFIKRELSLLLGHEQQQGFLTQETIIGYMEKLDFLLHPANELQKEEAALVNNARYILEDIINAAGIDNQGQIKYSSHESLVKGCYWVDEMLLVAKAAFAEEL